VGVEQSKIEFDSLAKWWRYYVPEYKSRSFSPFFARFPFREIPSAARRIRAISERRSTNRILNYVDTGEIERAKERGIDVSIRFGVKKPGHGYGKRRGDFCLVSAVYAKSTLVLFYRSIELIGGVAYDLVLIDEVCHRMGITPKFIEIWAVKGFIFALKGNSNEKLYPKLKKIFNE
jgi:hypothetical protein